LDCLREEGIETAMRFIGHGAKGGAHSSVNRGGKNTQTLESLPLATCRRIGRMTSRIRKRGTRREDGKIRTRHRDKPGLRSLSEQNER